MSVTRIIVIIVPGDCIQNNIDGIEAVSITEDGHEPGGMGIWDTGQ